MKTLIILITSLLLLVSSPDYSGEWSFDNDSNSISLTLQQKDSIVTGYHFAIMENGNRILAPLTDFDVAYIIFNLCTRADASFISGYNLNKIEARCFCFKVHV